MDRSRKSYMSEKRRAHLDALRFSKFPHLLTRTHCVSGHELTPENIVMRTGPNGLFKACAECARISRRRSKAIVRERRIIDGTYKPRANLRTHCPLGHLYSSENTTLDRRGKRYCRECKRIRSRALIKPRAISASTARLVNEAVLSGKNFAEITGECRAGTTFDRIVGSTSLYSFRKAHPKIDAKWKAIIAKNKGKRVCRVTAAPALLRNDGVDVFKCIVKATEQLFEPIRSIVQSDMWTDVAENKLRLSDIQERVRDYVRKYHRDNSHSVTSRYGDRSLDAPLNADGFSLIETMEDGAGWSVPVNVGRRVGIRRNGI